MNATTIGNNTVQQNDINWSKRILGKLALAQINVKIIILDLIPSIKLETIISSINTTRTFSLIYVNSWRSFVRIKID